MYIIISSLREGDVCVLCVLSPYARDEEAKTKYGFAPTYPPSLGVQSLTAGVGPVPSDPEAGPSIHTVLKAP